MYFNSLQFVVVFLLGYCLYVRLGHRWQNRALLLGSYAFYCGWDYRFLALLLLCTVTIYWSGIRMGASASSSARSRYLATSVIVNLGMLLVFKYFNFFVDSFGAFMRAFHIEAPLPVLEVVLPVGISFFTLQAMSYSFEVYRGNIQPCRNFFNLALYVSYFPLLASGPIERADHLLPQIAQPRTVTHVDLATGFHLFLWGLFKKLVIADNLALTVNAVFAKNSGFSEGEVLMASLYFAIQIYCDFSGYTDMARGVARFMGFDILENFNHPYFAGNPNDFWNRWHISLSTWLRDYLFLPLSYWLSRRLNDDKGRFWTSDLFLYWVAIFTTMLLCGLWHGAAWTFVLWGLYQGLLLCVYRWLRVKRIVRPRRPRVGVLRYLTEYGGIPAMFFFAAYGWLLFRAENLGQIGHLTTAFFAVAPSHAVLVSLAKLMVYSLPLVAFELWQYKSKDKDILLRSPVALQAAFHVFVVLSLVIFGRYDGASFIYARF